MQGYASAFERLKLKSGPKTRPKKNSTHSLEYFAFEIDLWVTKSLSLTIRVPNKSQDVQGWKIVQEGILCPLLSKWHPWHQFFGLGGRYDTTGVTPGTKKWKILTLVAWGLHEVKRVETKMALPDTLWFARKECRILALLVTNTRKTPKGQGKKMLPPLRANTGTVRHSKLAKERQNYEKKLWVHCMVNRMHTLLWFWPLGVVRGGKRWWKRCTTSKLNTYN